MSESHHTKRTWRDTEKGIETETDLGRLCHSEVDQMMNQYLLLRANNDLKDQLVPHWVTYRDKHCDYHYHWFPKHLALAVKNEFMARCLDYDSAERRMADQYQQQKQFRAFSQTRVREQKAERSREAFERYQRQQQQREEDAIKRQNEYQQRLLDQGCD